MDDDDNSFQEANLLLSTALKQLDDALNKGAPPSNIYRIYTESIQDLPRYTYMKGNGNTNGYNGYSDHRRSHSPNSDYKNANILEIEADVSDTASYENNNNNMNGHGHHNGHGNGHHNGHGHGSIMNGISKIDDSPHRLAWEATITNWDDGNEPKESSISSSSPDNFNPESPPTDIQSSSPDARMNRVGDKPPTPLRTFIKAIEDERIGAPDVDTTMKILKWLMKSPDIRYEKPPDDTQILPKLLQEALAEVENSVDLALIEHGIIASTSTSALHGSSSGLNGGLLKNGQPRSASIVTTCSASRPILPYVTHYSDSGFSSTLSSGSSCSYLPPPPPYRMRSSTMGSETGSANPLTASIHGITHAAYRIVPGMGRRQKKIHRSLSDSKYGTTDSSTVVLLPHLGKMRSGSSNFVVAGNDVYRINRGSSWGTGTSRMSLSPSPSMSTVSCPEYPELQEKLHRLAMARDSLSLQVAVLNEQVGAQKEKIRELEGLLAAKRKLYSVDRLAEDTSEKADLINEIANLKMKYSSLEKEKHDAERRLQMSQSEIDHLSQSMRGMINQPMSYQQQQQHQQQFTPRQNSFGNPEISQEMEQLRLTVQRLMADNEQKNYEINSLRSALDEHARSREIEGYTYNSLQRPQIMGNSNFHSSGLSSSPQPFDINAQLRKLLIEDVKENIGHSTSYPVGLNSQAHSNGPLYSTISKAPMQIPPSSSYTSSLSTASPQTSSAWSSASGTPRHQLHQTASLQQQQQQFVPNMGSYQSSSPAARQLAAELDELRRLGGMTQPSNIKNVQQMQYNSESLPRTVPVKSTSTFTLPRQKLSTTSGSLTGEFFPNWSGSSRNLPSPAGSFHSAVSGDTLTSSRRGSSKSTTSLINRWLQSKLKKNRRLPPTKELDASDMETSIEWKPKGKKDKRSTSVPNLGPRYIEKFMHEDLYNGSADASSELESDDELVRGRQPSVATSTGNFKRGRTRSTLRNIIGKLTRSTSQEIQSGQFKRGGGIRSSASARMVAMGPPISGAIQIRPPIEQFVDWTTEHVCEWFAEIGFSQYVPEVERYVRSGRHLLNMTNSELDKELLMKNPLHKKRLRCLLTRIERGTNDPAEKMDVHQVMLWLDEIGLPQYRDIFAENLIDGPILLVLTAQDLIEMKITSALNHATIARGIQFLRSADFSLYRLEKRFNAELLQNCPIPNEVEKWTHGCVCQWLKSIDLAEFTPNLMFSGVHGALMIHEPSFTAESLAEVLQIPAHKTLLRRHLTTQFNNLVGQDIIQRKREVLAQPYMTFLNPSLKIRLAKKGFSLARKKSKNEVFVEPEVPVCPPNLVEHKNEGNTETIPTSNV